MLVTVAYIVCNPWNQTFIFQDWRIVHSHDELKAFLDELKAGIAKDRWTIEKVVVTQLRLDGIEDQFRALNETKTSN